MNAGTRADHNRFCVTEEWDLVRDARGRGVRHHVTYELSLPDGRRLRTRISRPVNKTTYGPGLWRTILREQLAVGENEFWACVNDSVLPERGLAGPTPQTTLPAGLAYQLIHQVGLEEKVVATMSLEHAMAVMAEFWSRPPR